MRDAAFLWRHLTVCRPWPGKMELLPQGDPLQVPCLFGLWDMMRSNSWSHWFFCWFFCLCVCVCACVCVLIESLHQFSWWVFKTVLSSSDIVYLLTYEQSYEYVMTSACAYLASPGRLMPWLCLRACVSYIIQVFCGDNGHRALHLHTSFGDIDQIWRPHGSQEGEINSYIFLVGFYSARFNRSMVDISSD